jgi:site-specific DNA-methyltransferase (adenine-specific)
MFDFVPMQDFSKSWSDEELYEKYGISTEEVSYIEATIRSMDPTDG